MSRISRLKFDFKYMILNHFINNIPFWNVRKFFYSLFGLKIGKQSRIGIKTVIVEPKNIKIGDRTIINENCHLDGRGGIEIENDTSISFGTVIITGTHDSNDKFKYKTEKVIIKDHVWIGTHAIILNGSIIESYSIIGAGCVFKTKSNKNEIFVGNPARKIKERENIEDYKIEYKPFFR